MKLNTVLVFLAIFFLFWSGRNFPAEAKSEEITATHPLSFIKPVYQFSVSGKVNLLKENSFFRIILVDQNQNEYLVYETYPLLTNQSSFSFTDTCEETCILETVMPKSLRVEGHGASYEIIETSFLDDFQKLDKRIKAMGLAPAREALKAEKQNLKIQKLNEQIKAKGFKWIAGETSVSKMSYAGKKKLFTKPDGTPVDKLPNLQGFEYYKGGIFELKSDNQNSTLQEATSSQLPESWDWRNVHGENWNTAVRDQGTVGTCWAHTGIGAIESLINLYFNQHLNIDLSEQMLVDCANGFELPLGMNPSLYRECTGENFCYPGCDYCVIGIHGIADESCDPYVSRDIGLLHCNTNYVCNDWQSRVWRISDFHDYKFFSNKGTPDCPKQTMDLPEDDFKKVLITKGPMSSGITSWSHAMVLVGYQGRTDWKTIQTCPWNEFCDSAINECTPIECNNPGEEKTICLNNHQYGSNSLLITYKCELSPYGFQRYEWVKEDYNPRSCPANTKCVDNMCRPQEEYSLFEGRRECSLLGYRDFPREISIYAPQGGDNYWVFKNSWGTGWGEEGYARIDASLSNLGWGSLPLGPVIPPPGQSYQIACFDKDNDNYCNWGITTEKPAICPVSCRSEKDCNDSNPNLGPFDESFNCVELGVTPTPTQIPGQYFTVQVGEESFVFYTTREEIIREATRAFTEKLPLFPNGKLLRGREEYNSSWSWHFDPEDVDIVEAAMELCDGMPSDVEEDLDYWINTVGRFCPWQGRIVGICTPSDGDADKDERVTLLDFEIWREELWDSVKGRRADFNCDGQVNLVDFGIWRENYH